MNPITSHTCKLDSEAGSKLHARLKELGYEFREVPYAKFGAKRDKINVVYYESGKLVVQGKGTHEFVEFLLEPEILQEVSLGLEPTANPEALLPRIGVDESGKGDFFGPLCIAGVYVNGDVVENLLKAGVQDSKAIKSAKKIATLSEIIKNARGCVWTVVPVGNEAYNRLYGSMKSVNRILAWGHARVIENLMGQRHRMNPVPERVISDQFASSKSTVAGALMEMGREIELVQRHKAESDVAVAAASILARNEFVTRLEKLEEEFTVKLPKGASKAVDEAAAALFQKMGEEGLKKVSKMHFRTAFRAMGLPEPPKAQWSAKKAG